MTPAVTLLERLKVPHAVHHYAVDPDRVAGTYGEAVAAAMGVGAARVFKTLIAELPGGELVAAVVPVDRTLDLRALAAAAGAKTAAMADPAAAERATGYVTGGISPFGQRKRLRTFVDRAALGLDRLFVSAGRRGLQLEVTPADLVRVCGAETAELAK